MFHFGVRPQLSAVVNRADRYLTADVVNCYKQSATLGICCSQSSSVVFTVRCSCLLKFRAIFKV